MFILLEWQMPVETFLPLIFHQLHQIGVDRRITYNFSHLTHKMAHGHFGGMQVACLLWQRVCSEKFPSRTSLSGGFGKEAFLCVPLLLGSKRAVSPKCGHEPFYPSLQKVRSFQKCRCKSFS